MRKSFAAVTEKMRESALSVIPIIIIVLLLCLTVVPVSTGLIFSFLIGAALIIVGMGFFTLGTETSMTPVGSRIGASLTKSRRLALILIVSFLLGFAVTVAEPDLQVLAETVPHIETRTLIVTVGIGVGFFLAVCMLRIVSGVRLRWLLIGFYVLVFALAAFADRDMLSVAFDSGGVTTGPMTVPFILSFGVGIANIRSDRKAESDSFGLVALCSIGPVLAVLALSFLDPADGGQAALSSPVWEDTVSVGLGYAAELPSVLAETAVALAPIVVIFLIFQAVSLRLAGRSFLKILLGMVYTYVGLVLFLAGVNVGFSPLGVALGSGLAGGWTRWLLIPLSMVFGWFIISAEPAIYVLEKQIETVSSGAIPGRTIKLSLSVAIAIAMGLAMLRVVTGISVMWFLVPGYAAALVLSFFVPDMYTAIAFDSGGVASGPMTATFMLSFMMGACATLGGNILQDAFGVVALVAMMPLICIQAVGLGYGRRKKSDETPAAAFRDDEIIELWG